MISLWSVLLNSLLEFNRVIFLDIKILWNLRNVVGTEGIKRVSAAEKQNFRSHQESMYSVQNREEELTKLTWCSWIGTSTNEFVSVNLHELIRLGL